MHIFLVSASIYLLFNIPFYSFFFSLNPIITTTLLYDVVSTMNPSTLTPSHTHRPLLLPSPFYSRRHRFRVSLPRCSSDAAAPSPPPPTPPQRPPKDLKGIELLVDKLSPPARLATSAVIVAGAAAAGYGLGSRFGGSR